MNDDDQARYFRLIRPMHQELHRSSQPGQVIRTMCDCKLGGNHTYWEWLAKLGGRHATRLDDDEEPRRAFR